MLTIRYFRNSDVKAIIKLMVHDGWMRNKWLLLFTLNYAKWMDRIQQCLIKKSLTFLFTNKYDRATFVAENKAIIGVVQIKHVLDDIWFLALLIVHPKYQRKGVATKLLEKAISYAKLHNGKEVRSITGIDDAALKLYEKLGFTKKEVIFSRLI